MNFVNQIVLDQRKLIQNQHDILTGFPGYINLLLVKRNSIDNTRKVAKCKLMNTNLGKFVTV